MIKYKLKNPVVIGDETIEEIHLEDPTCEKLKKFNVDLSEEALLLCEGQYRIVCACAENVHEGHILKMKGGDLLRCSRECLGFFRLGSQADPE